MRSMFFAEQIGQGWLQFSELALALILSALIGLEREIRQKSAGLRTYTLVGLASALIILISKYGFTNILADGRVVLDPSRIAAQIVSGIGFIGGGVIFVRKDLVRGLTTATTVWVTSAVGMACGAGLPLLAIAVTFANFVVVFGFPLLERQLPKSRWAPSSLQVSYWTGGGFCATFSLSARSKTLPSPACRSSAMANRAKIAGASDRARGGQRMPLTLSQLLLRQTTTHPCRRRGLSRLFSNYGAVDPSPSW
jgi:putative Mg2+ transporter-C (MgtC) family protein